MLTSPDGQAEFFPPTSLEKSARATGADAVRYRVDYLMVPMRDGVRLATVVIRPKAAGRYPAVMQPHPVRDDLVRAPGGPVQAAVRGGLRVHPPERAGQRVV